MWQLNILATFSGRFNKNSQSSSCVASLMETLAFEVITFNRLASVMKNTNNQIMMSLCWALEFYLEGR